MRLPLTFGAALRLPRRTFRAELALLYAAVFGLACAAMAAVAVIFKPDFLVRTGCVAARAQTQGDHGSCSQNPGLSFAGTIAHDASQNVAGIAAVAVIAVLAAGVGWLIAGRVPRPLRTITATARDISARNLHQRLAVDGPDDEFRQLGETLDGLFGREAECRSGLINGTGRRLASVRARREREVYVGVSPRRYRRRSHYRVRGVAG